jgi:hypothetical protein
VDVLVNQQGRSPVQVAQPFRPDGSVRAGIEGVGVMDLIFRIRQRPWRCLTESSEKLDRSFPDGPWLPAARRRRTTPSPRPRFLSIPGNLIRNGKQTLPSHATYRSLWLKQRINLIQYLVAELWHRAKRRGKTLSSHKESKLSGTR